MTTKAQVLTIKKEFQKDLLKKQNVSGVGIGYKVTGGVKTDQLCLVVMVNKKRKSAALTAQDMVPTEIQGIKTDVIEIGDVVIHKARTDWWRPAPPGVSIGHVDITAGTFGAVVRDVTTGQKLILSNNHVLANSNIAQPGDIILQPGKADGGQTPQANIGKLERFVTIQMDQSDDGGDDSPTCSFVKWLVSLLNFLATAVGSKHRVQAKKLIQTQAAEPNRVDAAVAKPLDSSAISDEIIDIGKVTDVESAELNMPVWKSGRTTGTTEGTITSINAYIQVGYGDGRTASFEDQILTTNMSSPGDSGSLLVSKANNKAVGLLFAGSDTVTVHSPIIFVMDALNIDFHI